MPANPQFHSGTTPPRIGVAWPKKAPATSALRSSARPIGLTDLGIVEWLVLVVGQEPVVARAFERLGGEVAVAVTVAQSLGGISFEKFTSPDMMASVSAVTSAMMRYSIASK